MIAVRTPPRADMFTVLLFAAFLGLLWRYHRTGRTRLWLLPLLMMVWVNLHLGFVVGLVLIAGYVLTETLEMVWPGRREAAVERLRRCWPWLIAVLGATLVTPWGWEIYAALLRQQHAMAAQPQWIPEWGSAPGAAAFAAALAFLRSVDLVSDRSYLASTDLGSFGVGSSWWFPERAAAFIERKNIPVQIFNTYNEGGYFIWRLGSKYLDYVDGRAIPFGPELVERNNELMTTSPESPEWQREAEHYNINAILVPLGRYNGLHLFPMLRQFCSSEDWPPVYLDEVSAVFVRRKPENEDPIARLRIQCATAPLPAVVPEGDTTEAFNHWPMPLLFCRRWGETMPLSKRQARRWQFSQAAPLFTRCAEICLWKRGPYVKRNRNTYSPRLWSRMELPGHHWGQFITVKAD